MRSEPRDGEFRPERIPRRGELIAWACFLLVGMAWLILYLADQKTNLAVPILTFFLLLAALSISLGNWMDRQTRIYIDQDGLSFNNGLRHVWLNWNQIQCVQVESSGWGNKVSILGSNQHFEFRTLGEVKIHGEIKGRIGFTQGEHILQTILTRSGLKEQYSDVGKVYARN
jgi:hypothetical protein